MIPREMETADLADIIQMERSAFGTMAWSFADFERAIVNPYDHPLVLRTLQNGIERTVAYAVLRILGPEAEIENICVAEDCRGQGLGDALMDAMLRRAGSSGAGKVYLEVRSRNVPARRLYEKKGFTQEYVRKDYYEAPKDDALIMALTLT